MCVFVIIFNFPPLVILRTKEVQASIRRGQDMIISIQKTDGSWYGSWAICFTYACWFGIEALALDESSRKANKTLIDKCCGFLLSKQMSDGGWGESYQSCVRKEYRDSESGHVACCLCRVAGHQPTRRRTRNPQRTCVRPCPGARRCAIPQRTCASNAV